jgi:hypothetical protein
MTLLSNCVRGQSKKIEGLRAENLLSASHLCRACYKLLCNHYILGFLFFLWLRLVVIECIFVILPLYFKNIILPTKLVRLYWHFRILYFLLGWSENNEILVCWKLNRKWPKTLSGFLSVLVQYSGQRNDYDICVIGLIKLNNLKLDVLLFW